MDRLLKITILTMVVLFYGCNIEGEKEPLDTPFQCKQEYSKYRSKLKACSMSQKKFNDNECDLYDDKYKYSESDIQDRFECTKSIDATSCEEMKNIDNIADFPNCPTFRNKPKKK